jgi:hypothetical protein
MDPIIVSPRSVAPKSTQATPRSDSSSAEFVQATLHVSAADSMRDLRFICNVSWLITALRRPFSLGSCIVASSSGGPEAVYSASLYLQSKVAPLMAEAFNPFSRQDCHVLVRQILHAAVSVKLHHKPVVLMAFESNLKDPEQIMLLQHFIQHGSLGGSISPAMLLAAYKEHLQDLVDVLVVLELWEAAGDVRQFPPSGHVPP